MIKFYEHQKKTLLETENQNKVGYFLDMGLGKTFVGAEKMFRLGAKVNLVICQRSKIEDWKDHYLTYYPDYFRYDLTDQKALEGFLNVSSMNLSCIGFINYELVFRRSKLLDLRNFTLMLDESSMISNSRCKRSKFILKMKPDNVILLSGTPTGGRYEKLWTQTKLLGWNISKKLFYENYVIQEWNEDQSGFRYSEITGYKNVDRLKRKLNSCGCVFMKTEEAFDLPDMVEVLVRVPKTKVYRKFMKNHIVKVENTELIGDTSLTKLLYARMLCGHYCQSKLQAFKDLIESTQDRLIVFYNFNAELKMLFDMALGNRSISHISIVNGQKKDLEAYDSYDDSITFVQYQAGARGLNLQKANRIIYFTMPQSSDLFEQSKKRIHRIGQSKSCFYYLLMCSNSIEEHILQTLRERKDYSDALFERYIGSNWGD